MAEAMSNTMYELSTTTVAYHTEVIAYRCL